MDKFNGLSLDIEATEREKLRSLFPQCFSEDKLDIDKLLNLCGEYIDEDFEKYKFEWKGKAECFRIAGKRSTGTLRPCHEDSVDWDNTGNVYIEGDNLEVLKLMQTAYFRKVKMIYIDPPYNTGNDFVYEDDFADPLARYKEITEQTTKSNPESMGRFHTNWLNMMYPRLRLAANLLRDDGVIFISIDDNEVHNLRKLCDEVFGEENFVNQFVWQRAFAPKNDSKYASNDHDYIISYAKNLTCFEMGKLPRTKEANERYKNYDNDPRGVWTSDNLTVKTYSANYDYPITVPSGRVVNPSHGSCWRVSRERYQELVSDNRIWFGADGDNVPRLKRFLSEVQDGMTSSSLMLFKDVGHSQEGRQEVKKLFDDKGYFDGPKPIRLLLRLLTLANTDKDSIILDFFSGSATTAHAVMQLNAEDGGNRRFICVQIPELCDEKSEAFKAGYKNICEIGKERIRRAGAKIKSSYLEDGQERRDIARKKKEQSDQIMLHSDAYWIDSPEYKAENKKISDSIDTGFRVFKLDTSNLAVWDSTPIEEEQLDILWERFNALEKTILPGRSDMDIVFEVMLKMGVPLDYTVKEITVGERKCYSVGDDCMLLICLDYGITPEDITEMCELAPAKIIAAEEAFEDDTALSNAHYILKNKDIEMKLL